MKTSFHATLPFFPGPRRNGCVNPGVGCSWQHPPLQGRQECGEKIPATQCITLSEEADLKFMSAREEQKCKPHLGSALKAEGPHPLEAENPHHKALKNARKPCSTQALMGKGGYRPALGLCH